MMRPMIFQIVCGLLYAGSSFSAQAADCPEIIAPQKFDIKSKSAETRKTPGNRGIITTGFVRLPQVPTVHGIDVSKWQSSADFVRAAECGARFAYVRLSAGQNPDNELEYRSHWSNAKSVGLMTGPYHNLTLIENGKHYASLSGTRQRDLIEKNAESARAQARLFVQRLTEVLRLDPKVDTDPAGGSRGSSLGQPYLPIVLDVSFRPQMEGSANDRLAYGQVYSAAICAWIDEVRRSRMLHNQPVWLFTLPFVYKDYNLRAASCDVDRLPVWLSYRPDDGDAPETVPDSDTRNAIQALCESPVTKNRCVLQQYTSWGGFALYNPDEPLDLNRFMGTEEELRNNLQRAIQ